MLSPRPCLKTRRPATCGLRRSPASCGSVGPCLQRRRPEGKLSSELRSCPPQAGHDRNFFPPGPKDVTLPCRPAPFLSVQASAPPPETRSVPGNLLLLRNVMSCTAALRQNGRSLNSASRPCRALSHRGLHRPRLTAGDELRPPPSCGTSSSSCARLSRSVSFPPPVPAPPSPAARLPFSGSLRRRGVRRTNVSPASLPSCPSPLFRRASLSFPLRPRLPFCSGPPALLPCASSPSAERSPFPVMLHRPASSRLFRQQGINAWDSFAFFLKKNSGGRIFFSNSVKKTAPCTPSQNQPAIMAYLFPISIAVDGTYHFFLSPNHAS